MFTTDCPNCSKSYKIKENSYIGRKVQCKCCNAVFVASETVAQENDETLVEKTIIPDADDDIVEVNEKLPELPNYKCIRLLGYGGMGAVYEATQLSLNKPVAVKFLYTKFEKDANIIRRFKQEIDILAKLDHPNVVAVLECGTSDSPIYYVMEYIKGNSLNTYIQKNGMMSEDALRYALQIAAGLQHAHQHHVIHRDIKPDNVLIDQYGNAKLTDFGIAGVVMDDNPYSTRITQETTCMGTLAYMSPEQKISAATADERSDIYSFGVMVYQMLTGRLPEGIFLMPSQIDRSLREWDVLIGKCLDQEPTRRYQTMGEVITALKKHRILPVPLPKSPSQPDAVWSYRGSDGQWSGPYNQTQIQVQVDNFRILRNTSMKNTVGQQGVAVQLSWIVFPPEKDWCYCDKKKQWQGPFDMVEIQSLADNRTIRSGTFMKKRDGQQGLANQLNWISFPNPHPIWLRIILGFYRKTVNLLLVIFLLLPFCFVLVAIGHSAKLIHVEIIKEKPYIHISVPYRDVPVESEKSPTDEGER